MACACGVSETCVDSKAIGHTANKGYLTISKDYKIDLLREFKTRWMVIGVFVVVILAVLGPNMGAHGGTLRTQYLSYLPLVYVAHVTGRSAPRGSPCQPSARVILLSCTHAHLVNPALCIVAVTALRDLTDLSIVKGALYTCVGAPCCWLALALSPVETSATSRLLAYNYIASLAAVPLSTYVLCELAALPPWQSVVETCAAVLVPYWVGTVLPQRQRNETRVRLCALALLYAECCGRMRDAEGLMYMGDVLLTLLLEATCSVTSAATCWLYVRCDMLAEEYALPVALASLPKSSFGIVSSSAACSWSVHNLPAAVAPPLRAALLANMSARAHLDQPQPD